MLSPIRNSPPQNGYERKTKQFGANAPEKKVPARIAKLSLSASGVIHQSYRVLFSVWFDGGRLGLFGSMRLSRKSSLQMDT
jgi:hypothetical protein